MNWLTNMFSSTPPAAAAPLADDVVILDVRSPAEFAGGHVAGAINLPLDRFVNGYAKVVPNKACQVLVYCASGARSGQAVQYLQQQGYAHVQNGVSANNVARQYGRALA
jgi:phage shock protein E